MSGVVTEVTRIGRGFGLAVALGGGGTQTAWPRSAGTTVVRCFMRVDQEPNDRNHRAGRSGIASWHGRSGRHEGFHSRPIRGILYGDDPAESPDRGILPPPGNTLWPTAQLDGSRCRLWPCSRTQPERLAALGGLVGSLFALAGRSTVPCGLAASIPAIPRSPAHR